MRQFHLYLISDSTGETVSSVARAAVAQFEDVDPEEHVWSLVRTPAQLEKVLETIEAHPGVVMYTLVNNEMRDRLRQFCGDLNLPCVPVLARAISEMVAYLGIETSTQPGRKHLLNEEYFSRVEAVNFALAHDDGQATWELEEADIVIVGVSRTSKSPTCVYLANRGFKAANVPFVDSCPLPENLLTLKRPLIVGLTIDPDRLEQIRKSRLHSLDQHTETNYVDRERIVAEIAASRKLYARQGWPVIDVTRRAIEETAATILQHHDRHCEKRLGYGSQNG